MRMLYLFLAGLTLCQAQQVFDYSVVKLPEVRGLDRLPVFRLQEITLTGECKTAFESTSTAMETTEGLQCGAKMDQLVNDFTNVTSAFAKDYCESTCPNFLKNTVGNVLQMCGDQKDKFVDDDGTNMWQTLVQMTTLFRLVCEQDSNGQWCIESVPKLNFDSNGPANQAALDTLCTECTKKVMSVYKILVMATTDGNADTSSFEVMESMCLKRGGEYCALKFNDFQAELSKNPNTGQPTVSQLDMMCHPCIGAYLSGILKAMTELGGAIGGGNQNQDSGGDAVATMLAGLIKVQCTKNPAGEYCITKLSSAMSSPIGEKCPFSVKPLQCSAECQVELSSTIDSLGCCFGTLVNFMSMVLPQEDAFTITEIETQCGITIAKSCASKKIRGKIKLKNLKKSYVTANKDRVKKAVRNDLSTWLGVEAETVKIISISGITFTTESHSRFILMSVDDDSEVVYEVTPSSDTQLAELTAAIQDPANTVTMSATDELGVASKVDPFSKIGFQALETSTPSVEETGNGAFTGPTATLGFVLAVFSAFIF